MRETKNEELVQQRQREARAQNIVIHGLPEEADTQEGNIEADTNTIKRLFRIIEVEATPVSIVPLGKRTESKRRLIKIRMSTLNERELMMSSLGKLEVAPEKFKKISITEEYTIEEFKKISITEDYTIEEFKKISITEDYTIEECQVISNTDDYTIEECQVISNTEE